MSIRSQPALLTVILVTACTVSQRKEAENAAIRERAAQEIDRICALKGEEREAALEKFRRESGFELYCDE